MRTNVAFFITPHGFGHATRACAVMSALRARDASLHFHVFSDIPQSLLVEALREDAFSYHVMRPDVGLIQRTALCEDLDATAAALDAFYPLNDDAVTALAARLNSLSCAWVMCDVAPLGLKAARVAQIPSVLIENFTWDWIYQGYADSASDIARHAPYLKALTELADLRITTTPACDTVAGAQCVSTISRSPRRPAHAIREDLGAGPSEPLLLFNLGYDDALVAIASWPEDMARSRLVVPVAEVPLTADPQLICIQAHGAFYHPDLMYACDGIVGKLGYSTVAEAYHAGVPFAFLSRSMFRESGPLQTFVEARMPSVSLGADALDAGTWRKVLPAFMGLKRVSRRERNGADEVAELVLAFVDGSGRAQG